MFVVLVIVTTLLCGVITGFLFGFAVVAMPGIGGLDDRGFIRAFQVMDRVIQKNQPLFMLAWVGSVIGVLATAVVGMGQLDGPALALAIVAAALYLVGVQVPTAIVNIPLNNQIQTVKVEGANDDDIARERLAFEARWNTWNRIRTACATGATTLLLTLLTQL